MVLSSPLHVSFHREFAPEATPLKIESAQEDWVVEVLELLVAAGTLAAIRYLWECGIGDAEGMVP